MNKQE